MAFSSVISTLISSSVIPVEMSFISPPIFLFLNSSLAMLLKIVRSSCSPKGSFWYDYLDSVEKLVNEGKKVALVTLIHDIK